MSLVWVEVLRSTAFGLLLGIFGLVEVLPATALRLLLGGLIGDALTDVISDGSIEDVLMGACQ